MTYLDSSYAVLIPALALVAGGLLCLLLEAWGSRSRRFVQPAAILSVIASAVALYAVGRTPILLDPLSSEVASDLLTLAMAPAFYLSALGAIMLAGPYLKRMGRERGEFQALVLFSVAGMVLLAQARDLLILFLGLETLSIPLYVICGFLTDQRRSIESALKYFTIGAFSSAFVAFGMALAYAATGEIEFTALRVAIAEAIGSGALLPLLLAHAALAFLLVGFGFKIAMVPFHSWAGDVYEGAPTPVTAFLSVGSKTAGLVGLMRLLVEVFPDMSRWVPLLAVLAALTLVVGNTVAMLQENVKRLIAYSGVSHAGFLLVGLCAHARLTGPDHVGPGIQDLAAHPALAAVVYYVLAYAVMTLGAVAVIALVERDYARESPLWHYAGLSTRRPLLAASLLILMLSLGGMPPLAGFVGKWLVFQSAIAADLIGLAVVAALMSIVGFYYYLRVVYQMYLRPARADELPLETAWPGWALVGATVTATIVLGVAAELVLVRLTGLAPAVARLLH